MTLVKLGSTYGIQKVLLKMLKVLLICHLRHAICQHMDQHLNLMKANARQIKKLFGIQEL
ncbi:unnamed protein product [Absidia cylindrospora]